MKGNVLLDDDNMLQQGKTPHSGCYISTPAATTITSAGTYYLVQGTTTEVDSLLFTHTSPGKLTYIGTVTRTFFATIAISCNSSANNILIKTRIAKNGTTIIGSEQQFNKTTSSDIKEISSEYIISLATNDYLELFVTCDSAGSTITAQTGVFIVNEN